MIAIVLIAMAAGCASALMFASIISGALISLLLFYLAPLPLMVAALGWGPLSATIGGIAAAIGLGAIFGLPYCIAFVVTVALPAWWLGHLALLGRPVDQRRLVGQWRFAGGARSGMVSGRPHPALDRRLCRIDHDGGPAHAWHRRRRHHRRAAARPAARSSAPRDAASTGEIEQWIDALVTIAPAAAAIVAMMTLTLNLWLAAKITATSGRLHRPWPDLKSTALPPMTLAALCVAIAFCFVGGLLAILAQIVATALMMAYALTGFAVLHTLTLALKSRALWLSCTYAVVIVFSWPVLAMAALGLADAVFGLRQRYLQGRPPPLPAS